MTEPVKVDIIEDYAKLFCRRHKDREFNSMCDDCQDSYQTLLEFRRDLLFDTAAYFREQGVNNDISTEEIDALADGYD